MLGVHNGVFLVETHSCATVCTELEEVFCEASGLAGHLGGLYNSYLAVAIP